jgi:antitoxin component of MazEF toxin-antitoxin module
MTSNYKKYSLNKLEEWMHDVMSASEATPQEIYDVIKGVVEENYYTYKHQTSQAYELLALLNGNGKGHIESLENNTDDCMPPWGHSDLEYASKNKKDKVKRWVLPVEELGEMQFITFPDDLLEAANLNEGDSIEWVDNKDGSYIMKKIPQTYDEMIAAGYTMTADGFWIKE